MICNNNNNNNKKIIESRVRHRMTSSDTSDEHSSGLETILILSFQKYYLKVYLTGVHGHVLNPIKSITSLCFSSKISYKGNY
jgi:hypothetical protein